MKDKVNLMRKTLDAALDLLREQGIDAVIDPKSKYGDDYVRFGVTLGRVRPDGVVMTREASLFKALAADLGMSPDWLGQTLRFGGKTYQIIGLAVRPQRYRVLAREVGGPYRRRFASRWVATYMRQGVVA